MTTHLHLVLRTGSAPFSRSMQRLLGGYASAFSSRHRRVAYLFQSRFKSILVRDDPYLLELVTLHPPQSDVMQPGPRVVFCGP